MNPIAFHVASGDAFFSGCILIILSEILRCWQNLFAKWTSLFLGVVGICLVTLASSLPAWPTIGLAVLCGVVAWIVLRHTEKRYSRCISVLVFVVVLAGSQARYLWMPSHVSSPKLSRMVVIGDSISAGMNEPDDEKWPLLIAGQHEIQVLNLSIAGATTSSIVSVTNRCPDEPCLVLLEIGGNDVLGGRSLAAYAKGLRELLEHLKRPGRNLVMMELPLPPFHDRFSQVQRSLAAEFQVALIPKRQFLSVLASTGSTSDTIHLTKEGHQRMATMVWRFISKYFGDNTR